MPVLVLGWGIAQAAMAGCHSYSGLLAAYHSSALSLISGIGELSSLSELQLGMVPMGWQLSLQLLSPMDWDISNQRHSIRGKCMPLFQNFLFQRMLTIF
jgi:hypothetical protein